MASAFSEAITINPREYAFTDSGNIISRSAKIYGPQNIVINGRSVIEKECIVRGDLRRLIAGAASAAPSTTAPTATTTTGSEEASGKVAPAQLVGQATAVVVGRYLTLGQGSILRPPGKLYKG